VSLRNTQDQYGFAAKGLHWLSALIVLAMLPLGFYMASLDFSSFKLDLYWWHKSFGTLLFFIVALRLIWRFLNSQPAPHENHKPWERALAHTVHFLLYAGMVGMPLSGWLMSSAGDFTHSFFGLFEMPDLVPKNEAIFKATRTAHEITAYALIAAVGLHGLGAFKHHFIDRDSTLNRMLPALWPKAGAIITAALFVIMLGATTLLAGSYLLARDVEQSAPQVQAEAQEPAVAAAPEMVSDAPQWTIIPEQSRIGFKVDVQGAPFEGQFKQFDGVIAFDPDNLPQSRADMRVAIASVSTGSDERDEYIRMKPWLFVESFPESEFVTTQIEKTGENQYVAHATLTMRGVSLPVNVPFSLAISQNETGDTVAAMEATFSINRLDFGIGTGEWSSPETVGIAPTVTVSLQAKRTEGVLPQAQ